MAELTVDIVTPERLVHSGPAREVRVPGALGDFGVLTDHTEFLTLVRAGVATVVAADGEHRFVIGRGFAEAGPERVVILADSAESAEGIDKAAAKELLDASVAALASEAAGSEGFLRAQRDVELAAARLQA